MVGSVKKTKKGLDIHFLKNRLTKINKVLGKLETEVEKTVSRFMKRGEKSSLVLKKQLDEVVEKISQSDIYSRANEKGEDLLREVRRLADDVISKLKNFDLTVAKPVLKDLRGNVEELFDKIQKAGFVEKAKDKVADTRDQLLTVLHIPSQKDVTQLAQKVSRLEKRIKNFGNKHAA